VTWSLVALRNEVKDQLVAAGLTNVVAYWPDSLYTVPLVIVDGGDPYLDIIPEKTFVQAGQEFTATATARLRVTIAVGSGDSEALRNALDVLLCQVLAAIGGFERVWEIDPIEAPFIQGFAGSATALAIRVSMRTEFELKEV
jgi:hypothetical protein